jgi:NADH-quinone oxidoreductase subunit M
MFGKVENPKNERLLDLSHREFATFAPLLILAVWMGLYPAPFLRRLETSVQHIVARVNSAYPQPTAALSPATPGTPVPAPDARSAVPVTPGQTGGGER